MGWDPFGDIGKWVNKAAHDVDVATLPARREITKDARITAAFTVQNAIPLVEIAGGTALVATGVAAPAGAGLIIAGGIGLVTNIAKDVEHHGIPGAPGGSGGDWGPGLFNDTHKSIGSDPGTQMQVQAIKDLWGAFSRKGK